MSGEFRPPEHPEIGENPEADKPARFDTRQNVLMQAFIRAKTGYHDSEGGCAVKLQVPDYNYDRIGIAFYPPGTISPDGTRELLSTIHCPELMPKSGEQGVVHNYYLIGSSDGVLLQEQVVFPPDFEVMENMLCDQKALWLTSDEALSQQLDDYERIEWSFQEETQMGLNTVSEGEAQRLLHLLRSSYE